MEITFLSIIIIVTIIYWHIMKFRVRYRFLRTLVRLSRLWRRFKKKINQSITKKKPKIDSTQAKAIELFYALIKDKNSKLKFSKNSLTRIVDSEYVWMTMSSAELNDDYLQIIDETKRHTHSHDLLIPKEYGNEMADKFDEEMERRFRAIEAAKRKHITDDLDILIKKVKSNNKSE